MKKILLLCFGLACIHNAVAQNLAGVVSISAPASVAPGATFTATITMTNSGGNAWTTGGSYNLGSEIPRDNSQWSVGRIPLPSDPINPGEIAAFTTTFTAPITAGVYNFSWAMVQDGVEWFGAIASTTIKVGSPQFTPGDLIVMQVGDGSRIIANTGVPMFLNDFSLSGRSNRFQIALPVSGSAAIIGGLSQFTGMIDLSTDKRSIVVGGYNTNLGALNLEIAGSPRIVGTVSSTGEFKPGARTTTGGSTFRGTVSDGLGNFWSGGQAAGIQYLGTNFSPVQISTLGTGTGVGAIRDMIMVNGSIYFSTSQFPSAGNHGVARFTGAPTTPSEPELVIVTTSIPGATGTPNAKGFCINSNLTIAYVVDIRTAAQGGGIYRFNGNGTGGAGSWTYAYTIPLNLYDGGTFQEVVADFSATNPILYATAGPGSGNSQGGLAGNDLVTATDTGAATVFESMMLAPSGTTFRGLTFAPTSPIASPVLSIGKSNSQIIITWTGGGTLRSAASVTGPYDPVAGSPASPFSTSPTNAAAFYRVSIP